MRVLTATTFLALTLATLGDPAAALAQAPRPANRPAASPSASRWPSEGFFTISAGGQFGDQSFSESHSEPVNGEQFTWTTDYDVKTGFEFEAGGGWRVWRNLTAGATYSYFTDPRAASITGSVPHPFYFNQARAIAGDSTSLAHDEHGIHISATWMIPAGRHLEIGVFGGPSVFHVRQEFVESVEYTESYPFDTAEFSRAVVSDGSATGFGAHGGVDITWLINRQFGIGGVVRYSRGTVDIDTPAGGSVSSDAGGLQAAVGVRFRFNKAASPRPPVQPPASSIPGVPRPPAGSKPAASEFGSAVTTARAPFFLRPDATRTPLRELPVDTRLRVLEESGDWLRVEYNDPQYGRRVGYVQRMYVRVDRSNR